MGKEPISLTLKEFELLCLLLEHQGVVFTRDRLLNHIWGYAFDGESRTVDVHVRHLRQKLGECGKYIETVRGIGYRAGDGNREETNFLQHGGTGWFCNGTLLYFITGLLYEHYSNLQTEQLKETASYIEQGYEAAGQSYLETLHMGTNRVTLIAEDGTVLYDSQEQDVSQMGNHADREEVQQAEQDGVGFSRRFSSTMSKETVYYAVRLSDQSVLRVSVEYRSLFAMMGVLLVQALFILLVMLILALLVSYQLTKKIVKPINTLDLEHPEQVSTYEELDPLLCKLASQNREIVQKMDILRQQQYEFSMITEHMQEGLFVIDHAYTILTCNQSAMRLFGLQHSVLQKNILTVERGEPFRNVLDQALRGRHCTSQLEREGRVYQLIANPVLHNETPQEMQVRENDLIGVVILILDITEKKHRNAIAENLPQMFPMN